jgi:hypothetical protein
MKMREARGDEMSHVEQAVKNYDYRAQVVVCRAAVAICFPNMFSFTIPHFTNKHQKAKPQSPSTRTRTLNPSSLQGD